MPDQTRPRRQPSGPRGTTGLRRAAGAAVAVICSLILGACSNPTPSGTAASDGLIALVADTSGTSLVGWDGNGGGIAIALPDGATAWVATGRAGVIAASLTDGTLMTSDPVQFGRPLAWRPVQATTAAGGAPAGPDSFVAWDPDGGRFATLAGNLLTGEEIRVVVIDPSARSAREIPLHRPVAPAPPAWLDDARLVVVTGDAAAPTATIVDTTNGGLSDGPVGARLVATSANGRRIATMATQGAPVVVRDTTGWLDGDGSSIASVDPPNGSSTAIAFALDAAGQRLVIAWAAKDGSVTLAVHDARQGWRRVAQPRIGGARGAVVAWRR